MQRNGSAILVSWGIAAALLLVLAVAVGAVPGLSVDGAVDDRLERPGPENTGVPAGVSLTPSGPVTVTEDGAVIEGLDVDGCIRIDADDVVVRNTRIRCSRQPGEDRTHAIRVRGRNTLIEHVEIDGRGDPWTMGIVGSLVTVRHTEIHGVGDGIKAATRSRYESNYIHSLVAGEGQHNDGIQMSQGRDAVIRGNRIVHRPQQTSAILIKADNGAISDVTIEGNWLEGGNYTLYVIGKGPSPRGDGSRTDYATTDVLVRGNHFSRSYKHGILLSRNVDGLVWAGNVWDDTGEPIGPIGPDGVAPAAPAPPPSPALSSTPAATTAAPPPTAASPPAPAPGAATTAPGSADTPTPGSSSPPSAGSVVAPPPAAPPGGQQGSAPQRPGGTSAPPSGQSPEASPSPGPAPPNSGAVGPAPRAPSPSATGALPEAQDSSTPAATAARARWVRSAGVLAGVVLLLGLGALGARRIVRGR